MSDLLFYLDENISRAVAEQLGRWGIDAVSVHDLGLQGAPDQDHLQRATEMGRMLCTHDIDFIALAGMNSGHAGIAFAQHYQASVSGWVRALRILHSEKSVEDVKGMLRYVSLK